MVRDLVPEKNSAAKAGLRDRKQVLQLGLGYSKNFNA